MDADLHLVRAQGLDRVDDRDLALVDGGTAGGLDRGDDVADGDGAEQAAGVAGTGRDPVRATSLGLVYRY